MSREVFLVLLGLASVGGLIFLIARLKLNPFIALLVTSLALGASAGLPLDKLLVIYEAGVGNALGHIALVVGLGTMMGKLMAESGGAERIAQTMIGWFGPARVHWAMMAAAFLVGLPVFFEVGFVLLMPIVFTVAMRTGTSILKVGLPMVAGLSVVHGLIPPHPAALLAVGAYKADIGLTVLYALIVGIPTAALAGPIFATLIDRHVTVDGVNPMAEALTERKVDSRELPGFGITVATILLPVALMLIGSWADLFAARGSLVNDAIRFSGHPVTALLAGLLLSFVTFGSARGFDRESIGRFLEDCLAPTALITLIVGAGAGFGKILMEAGISTSVVGMAQSVEVPLLVLAWLVAAMMRIATGSATVAMATAAGIVAPVAAGSGVSPELLVLATGAGSLILSHVNDGGFWLVKTYFGLTLSQTFKTWTVCETLISIVALLLTLALSAVL
ncbi:permease DsdX [Sphingomonas koreensis]|uniref:GntT/GntP/DsdX family permease n=1 Tax=Sphingomonas koreensis TaxID=93064 RepID=UPI00082F7E4F|nr:gluconate:H+ symporter [Sphingomonas koreensis]PJI88394.1 gluconate permease GntT [Sphingomonas koreensis]RSU58682.1 permease DsdX [Sphingomonas koreensis]RSU66847.1 permease DsdX [Sphingomonas koreensis]